jgi:hypothetical protein
LNDQPFFAEDFSKIASSMILEVQEELEDALSDIEKLPTAPAELTTDS